MDIHQVVENLHTEESLALKFSKLPKAQRDGIIESMSPQQLAALNYDWKWWARPKQLRCFEEKEWSNFLYLCGRGFGKALALDTPIPTPSGWTTMGELKVGNSVFDENGLPCKVTFATEIQYNRKCYEVVFSDGTTIIADAEHQWQTLTRKDRKKGTLKGNITTTEDIRKTLTVSTKSEANHAVLLCKPVQYKINELPIEPYVLGVWLGDGSSACGTALTSNDEEIPQRISKFGYTVKKLDSPYMWSVTSSMAVGRGSGGIFSSNPNSLHSQLKEEGLLKNKHVPRKYLESSVEQRIELLKGMMDTDGTIGKSGTCCFDNTNKNLTDSVYELVVSLGIKAVRYTKKVTLDGRDMGVCYRVSFTPTIPVFHLKRKLERQKLSIVRKTQNYRYIKEVKEITSVPVKCIKVDSPSSLFLCSESFVVTHNTRTGTEWVKYIAENNPGCYIAVVGPTTQSVNRTLVDGPTGLMNICDPGTVHHQRTKAQIKWKNGSIAMLYSAERPDRLRGPNHHFALADEIVAWKNPETWDMLKFTLRIGARPQTLITTTPRPTDLILRIIGGENNVPMVNSKEFIKLKRTVIVRGTTFENTALSEEALEDYRDLYANTVMGDQELYAKLLINIQGALFKKDWIIHLHPYEYFLENEIIKEEPVYVKTVVAIDPATTSNSKSDQTAICVASKGEDGRYYIRHCEGYQMSPDKWATEVVKLYKKYNATKIVAETNNGGDMVENTIRHVKTYVNGGRSYNVDAYTIPIEKIHAKKGKLLRAEEVALLYEQRRVTHISTFSELESQMVVFKGEPNGADDLVDAMVYAIKELAGVREIEAYAPQVIGQGLVSDRLILL